ncbi:MAG: CapA family protein [Mycobacteriales bacterium]
MLTLVRRYRLLTAVLAVVVAAAITAPLRGRTEPAAAAEIRRDTPSAVEKLHVPVTLAFAGDVHFEGALTNALARDPAGVLAPIAPVLRKADVAVVNLETAITTRGTAAVKTYTYRAPGSAFTALRTAGIDAVSMANNHGLDFGSVGLVDSLAAANAAKFPIIGIGSNDAEAYRPYVATVRGQRIAVIAATQVIDRRYLTAWTATQTTAGLASAKEVERLTLAVREARKTSDTVVVYLHWGIEGAQCPSAAQRTLADELVTAGADVIVGSHAHVLQGAGRSGTAFVAYGLGNFAFYARGGLTTQSGVLTLTVTGRNVDTYAWSPAVIKAGVPTPLAGAPAQAAVASWNALRACTGLAP